MSFISEDDWQQTIYLNSLTFLNRGDILDVGCGLGGAARYLASRYKNRVTGIDLTPEYIETGKVLCSWLNLDEYITLEQGGSALLMPFQDSSFDGGYMLHVGMNIDDKESLFAEIFRVLKPGSTFGVYDVMRQNDGALIYPSSMGDRKQYQQTIYSPLNINKR